MSGVCAYALLGVTFGLMMTPESDHTSSNGGKDRSQTPEERLGEAVAETSEQAANKDEDEVEADLRSAMAARGLEPGDTSDMASIIADAMDEFS